MTFDMTKTNTVPHIKQFGVMREEGAPISNSTQQMVPDKERLIVQHLRDFIDTDVKYPVALVAGIRKVGKTVALQQLNRCYEENAVYFDLSRKANFREFFDEFVDKPKKLLLLDEIMYLDDFETVAQYVYNMAARCDFKVVMTGSSSAHIMKLSISKLGGGRARLFRLPPITFVEYLYLTDRIPSYTDYSAVKSTDFADYLLLKDLTPALKIQFDADYFSTFFSEVKEGNESRGLSNSLVDLKENDLQHMCNIIAYKLNEAATYDRSVGHKLKVAGQEYDSLKILSKDYPEATPLKWSKINISDMLVAGSHSAVRELAVQAKGRILHFLLWSGLASIELKKESDTDVLPDVSDIVSRLKNATKPNELIDLFDEVSICLITPLFYTHLGVDAVTKTNVDEGYLCKGSMLGKMLEVYLRGAVALRSANRIMSCVKLNYISGLGEVDVYDEDTGLLLEITCSDKTASEVHLQNYMVESDLLRVCSTDTHDSPRKCYHRIPYAKLCCMLDTGDVFELRRSKGLDVL